MKRLIFLICFIFIVAQLVDATPPTPPSRFLGVFTVGDLPSAIDGDAAVVTDGSTASDCTVGGGSTLNLCLYDEGATTWVVAGDGTSAGAGSGSVTTLEEQDAQIGGADIVNIDFQEGFSLVESPDQEVNVSLDVTPTSGSSTLVVEQDALQVKYDTTDFTEGATGLVLSASPTMTGSPVVGTALVPDAADGATLGTTTYEFSDLFLADGSTIKFGADQDVVITHDADDGLTFSVAGATNNEDLNLDLETNANTWTVSSSTGAKTLQLTADDIAIKLDTATATDTDWWIVNDTDSGGDNNDPLEIGNNATIGTSPIISVAQGGVVTFADDIVIKDTGTIGSASDTDAMSIAADGTIDVVGDLTAGTITSDAGVGGTTITASTGFALGDGDYIGITGNEIITFNAAGTIVASGASFDVDGDFTASTITSDAALTATTDVIIGDAGNIGSASDTDAIAIAANGEVTLSQELQAGAGIDGSGGTVVLGTVSGTIDAGGATSLEIPNKNGDPSATGQILIDTTVTNFTDGALRYYDGNNIRQTVDMVAATAEGCTDDQVVAYDADNDLFYCKNDADTGGATALDDIGDPDAAASISMDDTETLTFTSAQDTAGSVVTIQDSDNDVANQVYLLDLDYSADDGQANADFIIAQDSGGTVWVLGQDGDVTTTDGDYTTTNGTITAEQLTSTDDLTIADGGNIGSASDLDAIAISSAGVVSTTATTEASAVGTAAVVIAGGLSVAKDIWMGDDLVLDSDSAVIDLGADQDVLITHVADTGINITTTAATSGTINLGNDDDANDDSIDLVLHDSGIITLYDADDDTSASLSVADGASDLTLSAGLTLGAAALIDATGAVDMDYGSGDITDHSFISDGGTTIIDGSIQFPDANGVPSAVGELQYDNTITGLDDGGLVWYDDDEVQTLVALDSSETLEAGDDGYAVTFNWNAGAGYFTLSAAGTGDVLSVGDCNDGACLDGTSDGGSYISLYDGDSNKLTFDVANLSGDATIVFGSDTNNLTLVNGTATVDIAAGADLDLDVDLTVDGQKTTITGAGQANTLTLNEGLTVGDGNTGTITFSAASKTITVADNVTLNQDLQTTDSPTFAAIDTGEGSTEVYAMDQDVQTTDGVTFATVTLTDVFTLSDAATIDQSANNLVEITENSDSVQFGFAGTDLDIVWSDGALNLRNAEDGVDAIVEIEGKDAGEKGVLRVLSDGDDKYITAYHDDTDSWLASSSGDLILAPDGDTDDYIFVSTATNVTSISAVGGDGTLGTAAAEWGGLFLGDGIAISFGDDQDVTLTHVADTGLNLNEALSIADDKALTFGGSLAGYDWTVIYDETTSDALEFTHTAGAGADVTWDLNDNAAASTFTISNSDGTYAANLVVDGTITSGGTQVQTQHAYLTDIVSISSPTEGDLMYFDGTDWTALAPGTSGYFLSSQGDGSALTWASGSTTGSAEAYDATGWDADATAPTKNDVRDYLVNFDSDGDGSFLDETWYSTIEAATVTLDVSSQIDFDLEDETITWAKDSSNVIGVTTDTGVTEIDFGSIIISAGGINMVESSSPQWLWNDSNGAGADDADKLLGAFYGNMSQTTEDSEIGDIAFTYLSDIADPSVENGWMFWDGSIHSLYMGVGDWDTPWTWGDEANYESLKFDFDTGNDAEIAVTSPSSSDTLDFQIATVIVDALTTSGLITSGGNLIIPDAGNIGSASDTDSIAIAANGETTFSQEIQSSAGIDANGQTVYAGNLILDDAGTIQSASDADAITLAANGEVTLTQELQAGAGIDASGQTIIADAFTGTASLATTVTVSDDEGTDDAQEIVFTTDNTNLESDGDLTYNPNSGTLTVAVLETAAADDPYIVFDESDGTDVYIVNDDTGDEIEFSTDSTASSNNIAYVGISDSNGVNLARMVNNINYTGGETQHSITEAELLDNHYHTDQGGSAETDLQLPAVSYYITAVFIETEGNGMEICPPTDEIIDLDGTALDANDCVDSDSTVGSKIVATRMLLADGSTWRWSLDSVRGLWTDTGAGD